MSSLNPNVVILKSLYRSLLKQSRILDQSPIHQCFLISKPKKIYVHDYGTPVQVKLTNADFEIVERILNEHCGGEYFAPALPGQPSKSLQQIVKHYFRFGVPTKYDPMRVLDPKYSSNTERLIFNKSLELAFYAKKRLHHATNVIGKMPIGQQTQFLNAFNGFSMSMPSSSSEDGDASDTAVDTAADLGDSGGGSGKGKFSKIPLTQPFSLKSLTPLTFDHRGKTTHVATSSASTPTSTTADTAADDDEDAHASCSQLEKGTLLVAHPLACLAQPELYRKVIYIIENSADRIVGVALNAANALFDDVARKSKTSQRARGSRARANTSKDSEFEYCFRGWKGEYNYVGGPVNDQSCPFCIMHDSALFYDKFKASSIVVIDAEKTNSEKSVFWTWVTQENYQGVYEALNRITKILQHKERQQTQSTTADQEVQPEPAEKVEENASEISGKNDVDEAQIVAESSPSESSSQETQTEASSTAPAAVGAADELSADEFYEQVMRDDDNNFKFFQKYAYWSPEQLMVEIKNNVWFAAKLTDVNEEQQLLNLKCPSNKLLENRNKSQKAAGAPGTVEPADMFYTKSNADHKKQYNKWMWQAVVKAFGNEYQHLAVFPDLNNEQTKEFYAFMEEFHHSWTIGDESEPFDSDDEDEGQDTIW